MVGRVFINLWNSIVTEQTQFYFYSNCVQLSSNLINQYYQNFQFDQIYVIYNIIYMYTYNMLSKM